MESTRLKTSIPILIVGNKLDMVSVQTQQELRDACPQQLFMSSQCSNWDCHPILDFFLEVHAVHYGEQPQDSQEFINETITMSSDSHQNESFPASVVTVNPLNGGENTTSLPTVNNNNNASNHALPSVSQISSDPVNIITPEVKSPEQKEAVTGIATPPTDVIDMASLWSSTSSTSSTSYSHSTAFSLLRHRISKW
mmetsp:Transcript_34133/g.49598  ORF Transcript_34133/g.49598 Transcript_34133/m.49598 type:complete len:196 (+) Transcript_34133:436-1023(+)